MRVAGGYKHVVEWLLDTDQPSIRFLTLRELFDRRIIDEDVVAAKDQIPLRGWVHRLLKDQREGSYWARPTSCYIPRCVATVWYLQLLAVLGMEGVDSRIRNACERFLRMHTMPDGGFACSASVHPGRRSEECISGRMTAVLLEFGYRGDPRVENAIKWLLDHQLRDGGWNCHSPWQRNHSSIYSTYMALWGLSKVPKSRRSAHVKEAIEKGVEFMLAHRLFKSHRTGRIIYDTWLQLRFPPNVNYDILHSARLTQELTSKPDERIDDAIDIIESKMKLDGRWVLDAVPSGDRGRDGRPQTIQLEEPGIPSKWVTLQSLILLTRAGRIRLA